MSFEPEIRKGDELYNKIVEIISNHMPDSILEIGSANGLGSTQAILEGVRSFERSEYCPKVHLVEINAKRFMELVLNTMDKWIGVDCFCGTIVDSKRILSEPRVVEFLEEHDGFVISNKYPVEDVLNWRESDLAAIESADIVKIDEKYGLVIMDGSAFTGYAELQQVYGADFIIMDDTIDIKNYHGYKFLIDDNEYSLVCENKQYRNGYAIFERNT